MLRLRGILSFLPCEMAAKAMQAERTGCALAGSAGFRTGHVPNWLLAALESQVPNSSLLSSRRGVLRCGRGPLVALVLLWGGVPFFLGVSWKIKKKIIASKKRDRWVPSRLQMKAVTCILQSCIPPAFKDYGGERVPSASAAKSMTHLHPRLVSHGPKRPCKGPQSHDLELSWDFPSCSSP